MIKAIIANTDEAFPEDRTEIVGRTVLTISVTEKGISSNIMGYVTPELLKALRRDVPKVIDKLSKEIK